MGALCTTCSIYLEIYYCFKRNLLITRKYWDCSGDSQVAACDSTQPGCMWVVAAAVGERGQGRRRRILNATSMNVYSVKAAKTSAENSDVIRPVIWEKKAAAVWRLD